MLNKKRILIMLILSLTALLLVTSLLTAEEEDLQTITPEEMGKLFINAGGASIEFDPNSKSIYFSPVIRVEHKRGEIHLTSVEESSLFSFISREEKEGKIIVGTAASYSLIDVQAAGASVNGKAIAEKIRMSGAGMSIKGTAVTEEINISGAGIHYDGLIKSNKVSFSGAGMNIFARVEGVENIDLSGLGITASIRYLDGWEDERHLSISGLGCTLRVSIPSETEYKHDGQLRINKEGVTEVNVHHY